MQKLSSLGVVIRKITNIISFIEITIQLTKKINDILFCNIYSYLTPYGELAILVTQQLDINVKDLFQNVVSSYKKFK